MSVEELIDYVRNWSDNAAELIDALMAEREASAAWERSVGGDEEHDRGDALYAARARVDEIIGRIGK
jgi:hypothetical protein